MRTSVLNSIFLGIFFYFIFHGIYGDRGAIAYFTLSKNLEDAIVKLESLRVERLSVEHKMNLLKSSSLDPDFLDEEARRMLGYANPREEILKIESDD